MVLPKWTRRLPTEEHDGSSLNLDLNFHREGSMDDIFARTVRLHGGLFELADAVEL